MKSEVEISAQALYEAVYMELSHIMEPKHIRYDITKSGAISITWDYKGTNYVIHARPESDQKFRLDGFHSYEGGNLSGYTGIRQEHKLDEIFVTRTGIVKFGEKNSITLTRYIVKHNKTKKHEFIGSIVEPKRAIFVE